MILLERSRRFQLVILILLGFFTNQSSAPAPNLSSTSVATTPSTGPTGSVHSTGSSSNSVNSTATSTGSVTSHSMSTGSGGSTVTSVGSGGSTGTSAGSGGSNGSSNGSGGLIGTPAGPGGSPGTSASPGYATGATVGSGSNTGPTVFGDSSGAGNSMTTTVASANLVKSSKAVTGVTTNQQSASVIQYATTLKATVKPLKVEPDFVENSLTIAKTYYAEITFPAFLGLMIFIIAFMTVTAGKASCLIKPCTKGQVDEDYKLL